MRPDSARALKLKTLLLSITSERSLQRCKACDTVHWQGHILKFSWRVLLVKELVASLARFRTEGANETSWMPSKEQLLSSGSDASQQGYRKPSISEQSSQMATSTLTSIPIQTGGTKTDQSGCLQRTLSSKPARALRHACKRSKAITSHTVSHLILTSIEAVIRTLRKLLHITSWLILKISSSSVMTDLQSAYKR